MIGGKKAVKSAIDIEKIQSLKKFLKIIEEQPALKATP